MEVITISGGASGDILRDPLINLYSTLAITPVWRAVTFVADNLASFPKYVAEDGIALTDPHPLDYLLNVQANPNQTAFDFWRKLFTDSIHRQNGYAYVARSQTSIYPTGLYNLETDDVDPYLIYLDPQDITSASLWYWHRPSRKAFPAADIIHIKGNAGGNCGLVGHDPAILHRATFTNAALIEMRAARAIRRGTSIIGTVELPGDASEEEQALVKSEIKKFSRPDAHEDVLLLSGGAKLNNQALTPTDLQLDEQRRAITRQIAQLYGVDPIYLFDRHESQYSNNAEQSGQDVTRFTLRNWMENSENEISVKILPTRELSARRSIEFDADALLRGNTETQSAVEASLVAAGIKAKNEARKVLGLAPDSSPESAVLLNPHAVASAPKGDANTGGTNGA